MVIGIIGAGISGLTAGRLLAKAGHEVTVFEKSGGYGGRMATRYAGNDLEQKLDHGAPLFEANEPEFKDFVKELLEKELIKPWGKNIKVFDGQTFSGKKSLSFDHPVYTSKTGMNAIGKYQARWCDVQQKTKVGGLTYFGDHRSKKRPWIINMTSSNTFGADAVILALPAPQAYGILSTTIDETNTLKIVRQIDEIHYNTTYTLMVGFKNGNIPDWEGIVCKGSKIGFISNEGLKRDGKHGSFFVLHSSAQFAKEHRNSSEDVITKQLIGEFARVAGGWASTPEWHQLHFWRFSQPKTVLDQPFFELEEKDSPLALVGDYYYGNSVGHAYASGYKLAQHWIEKFK